MHHFAHKIGVSNTYLSRVIHQEKTYIYTLLEYLVECGARISISVIDKDCRIILSLSSTDVKELAKALGIVCRAEILKRKVTVADFAEDIGKSKQDIYSVLNAKNKASIDHLFDLFEILGSKVNLNYEI